MIERHMPKVYMLIVLFWRRNTWKVAHPSISQGIGNKSLGRIHGCASLKYFQAVNSIKHSKSPHWMACWQDLRSYFLGKFRPVVLFALFFGRSLCSVHSSILLDILDTCCSFRWWIPFHTQASHELQIVSFADSRHFFVLLSSSSLVGFRLQDPLVMASDGEFITPELLTRPTKQQPD